MHEQEMQDQPAMGPVSPEVTLDSPHDIPLEARVMLKHEDGSDMGPHVVVRRELVKGRYLLTLRRIEG